MERLDTFRDRFFRGTVKLSVKTISKIWIKFGGELSICARPKEAIRWSKLRGDNLELIELMKTEKPSVSLVEIISCLEEMDGVEVSGNGCCSRALKHSLPSGPYIREKIATIARERCTPRNILHTTFPQLFSN